VADISGVARMNIAGMTDSTLQLLREELPPGPLLDAVADEIEARCPAAEGETPDAAC
jgi:hypothetical protein